MTTRNAVSMISVCALLALAGCGTNTSNGGSAAHTDAGGGLKVPGDGPVDTVVAIDRTAVLHGDRSLARAYRAAALLAGEATITRGGLLSVRLFGRVGARSLNLRTETVPSLRDEGVAVRGSGEAQRRVQVAGTLDVALGLTPCSGEVCSALHKVTETSGSDIARAVGDQIVAVAQGTSATKVVVVLTDGLTNQGDVVIAKDLPSASARTVGKAIVKDAGVPAGTAPIQLLRIAGIGETSGEVDIGATQSQRLADIWSAACARLPVQRCEIAQAP